MQIARSFDNMQHAEMFTTNLFCSSHSIRLHAMIFHILSLLQLQVNWGIFVLFDPLRRVGLMYINVFWYIVYHPVYKQRTKRHGGAIFFNISDTFRSQCVALSLYSCSFPGRLIHLQTTLTWPFYLYFLFRFVIDMEIVKGLRSLPP